MEDENKILNLGFSQFGESKGKLSPTNWISHPFSLDEENGLMVDISKDDLELMAKIFSKQKDNDNAR